MVINNSSCCHFIFWVWLWFQMFRKIWGPLNICVYSTSVPVISRPPGAQPITEQLSHMSSSSGRGSFFILGLYHPEVVRRKPAREIPDWNQNWIKTLCDVTRRIWITACPPGSWLNQTLAVTISRPLLVSFPLGIVLSHNDILCSMNVL